MGRKVRSPRHNVPLGADDVSTTTNGSTLKRALKHETENLGPHTYRKRLAALESIQARTLAQLQKERARRITAEDSLRHAEQEVLRLTRQNRSLWDQVNR